MRDSFDWDHDDTAILRRPSQCDNCGEVGELFAGDRPGMPWICDDCLNAMEKGERI